MSGSTARAIELYEVVERAKINLARREAELNVAACQIPEEEFEAYVNATEEVNRRLAKKQCPHSS